MPKELQDEDMMPFGKYGPKKEDPRKMKDVPASYYCWLWTNGLNEKSDSDVGDYIRRNMEALKQEHPDGIW